MVRSISVAVRPRLPSFASSSTLDRIGMVLRRSTTLCTCARDFNRAPRSMVSFMAFWELSRNVKIKEHQVGDLRRRRVADTVRNSSIEPTGRGLAEGRANQGNTIAEGLEKVSKLQHRTGCRNGGN